jgi:hypothetical protein
LFRPARKLVIPNRHDFAILLTLRSSAPRNLV